MCTPLKSRLTPKEVLENGFKGEFKKNSGRKKKKTKQASKQKTKAIGSFFRISDVIFM